MNILKIALVSVFFFGISQSYAQCGSNKKVHKASYNHQANTLVDIAVGSDIHKTLVTALQAADLVDALKGDGPFTVFAPTDNAFAKVPGKVLNDLLKPSNKEALQKVLTYHVIPAKVDANTLVSAIKSWRRILRYQNP